MAQRYFCDYSGLPYEDETGDWVRYDKYQELEAENARLRQQRDAANAQLDFILENLKCDTPPAQNVSSQD